MNYLSARFYDETIAAREMYYRFLLYRLMKMRNLAGALRTYREEGLKIELTISHSDEPLPDGATRSVLMNRLSIILGSDKQGSDLLEYLENWVAAVNLLTAVDIDEMLKIWPYLTDIVEDGVVYRTRTTGPEIDPEGD